MLKASSEEIATWNNIYKLLKSKYKLDDIFKINNNIVQSGNITSSQINSFISMFYLYGFLPSRCGNKDSEISDILTISNMISIGKNSCYMDCR